MFVSIVGSTGGSISRRSVRSTSGALGKEQLGSPRMPFVITALGMLDL
jgi:hypothetical protein